MTTKPKPRKAPAAKAVMKKMNPEERGVSTESGWPIENQYDRNFSSNDIPKLIARWRFLEADRHYHAAVADHPELAKAAMGRHYDERS